MLIVGLLIAVLVLQVPTLYYLWLNERRWRIAAMMAQIARGLAGDASVRTTFYAVELGKNGVEH